MSRIAPCPRTCRRWNDCYGNHMHMAARQPHGDALEDQLDVELFDLSNRYPDGFIVRLHNLGDFYSLPYVQKWGEWLKFYKNLHVFGYTAWMPDTMIGRAIHRLNDIDRWWIRFSDGPVEFLRTGDDGIPCPAQTGKTRSCATCALCWTPTTIRFLEH